MFGKEWMEFFETESPITYYCILFLQFLVSLIPYFSYIILLVIVSMPLFMMYSGVKGIKVKLIKNKINKKLKKDQDDYKKLSQNLYLQQLDKNIKYKKKSKHS